MTYKKYAYISGALTNMSDEARATLRDFYEKLAGICREFGLGAYVPHLVSDPKLAAHLTPQEVDDLDREAVMGSCLLVAYVGVASLGVGIEIEMAYHAHKPVVLLCEKETVDARKLSRLVRGNRMVMEEVLFRDLTEAEEKFRVFLRTFCAAHRDPKIPQHLRV